MLNRVLIMGRLGQNPEKRYTQGGTPVATFSLAVDRDFKDKASGERVTDWVTVVAWRQTAEFVCRYFTKGRVAVVDGRLQTGSYTDRDGVKRKTVEIVADSVYFGDSKSGAAPAPSEGNADKSVLPEAPRGEFWEADDEEKMPF